MDDMVSDPTIREEIKRSPGRIREGINELLKTSGDTTQKSKKQLDK